MKRGVGKNLAISLAPVIVGLAAIALATLLLNACGARHDEKATADNPANANTSPIERPSETQVVKQATSPTPTKDGPTPSPEKTVVEKSTLVPPDSPEQQTGNAKPTPTQTVPIPANSNGVGSGSGYSTDPYRGGPLFTTLTRSAATRVTPITQSSFHWQGGQSNCSYSREAGACLYRSGASQPSHRDGNIERGS